MKVFFGIIRILLLFLSLTSISSHWAPQAQYTLAIICPFVWGVTYYMEGYNDL